MLDLHSARRSAEERARAQKADPKTATFAAGARNKEESAILTALRKQPATSVGDLRDRVKFNNELAFTFAYNALRDRGALRETAEGYFGVMKIVASETPSD